MEKSGSRSFTLSWWPFVLAFLVLCLCSETCNAKDDSKSSCTSSCGLIRNITHPFRLNDDPKRCGDRRYTLSCENNITVLAVLDPPYSSGTYHVQAINYKNHTIRLLDPGLDNNNCSSLPQNLPPYYFLGPYSWYNGTGSPLSTSVYYLRCRNQVNSSLYVDTAPCLNNSATSLIQPKSYSYVMVEGARGRSMDDLNEGCGVERKAWMLSDYSKGSYTNDSYSYEYIHSAVMNGFELRVYWPDELLSPCNGSFYIYNSNDDIKCFPRGIPGA
ncbi:hypothetical protein ACFX13_000707 [Malus domestica]